MPTPKKPPVPAAREPLGERDIDALQQALDAVPAPLEPLDVSMLDGYLCGVLLQPRAVPASRWLPHVCDVDGRALPPGFDARALHALVHRRHAELDAAITRRDWFDPWVFELEAPAQTAGAPDDDEDAEAQAASEAVYPWVAGFATALELFPELMALDAAALTEPLALVYRHLDPDDLEDADALLEVIESFEPPTDLAESVEGLVRATLLLADISRPLQRPKQPPQRPRHRPPARRR